MSDHQYSTVPNPLDDAPWYKRTVKPVCACGWQALGYVDPYWARSTWASHLPRAGVAA